MTEEENAAAEDDQSMEEILQSIKRIIADDEEEGEGEGEATPDIEAVEEPASEAPVLDLTEVVQDDGTVVDASDIDEPVKIKEEQEPEIEQFAAESATMPLPEEEPAPEPDPIMDSFEEIATPAPAAPAADESLVSDEAASASASALQALLDKPEPAAPAPAPTTAMPFRSGHTVEDLAMEALRPMLKDWLDSNLPQIVERLVQKEIQRISADQ